MDRRSRLEPHRPRGCWRCCRTASARSRQSHTPASSSPARHREEDRAMDVLVAEAILEFGDDLRAASQAAGA